MLAHQVAGKAVRDSFFLSNYPASDLPKMVIAAAAVTIVLVLLFARAMRRFGPQRLVPAGFFLSSIAPRRRIPADDRRTRRCGPC